MSASDQSQPHAPALHGSSDEPTSTGPTGVPPRWVAAGMRFFSVVRQRLDVQVFFGLLVVSAALALVNVGGWYVLHFIDILWPLNPAGNLSTLQFGWSPVNLGTFTFVNAFNYPLAVWLFGLGAIGVPIPIQEVLTLALLQFVGGYAFFILVRRFVLPTPSSIARSLALLAAVAYLVNYYTLTVGWWDNVPGFFWLMGFGPLFLYFALDFQAALRERVQLRPFRIAALGVSSFFAFSTNVPFNVSLVALAALLPLIVLVRGDPRPRTVIPSAIIGYVVIGATIIATSLWWILPDYLQSVYAPGYVGGGYATSYNLSLFTSSSSALTVLTILTGLYGVEYPSYAHSAAANAIYADVAGPTSILIGAVILAGTLLAPAGPVRRRQGALAVAVVVVGLFFLGVNSPIASGLEYLLESSSIALQALRNPFLSFGFAMCVLLILLFAHSAEIILVRLASIRRGELNEPAGSAARSAPRGRLLYTMRRVSSRVSPGVSILLAVLLFVPLFSAGAPVALGDAVPSAPFDARAAIPPYEYAVANYLGARLNNSYALLYPGGFLEQNWTHGYDGYDVLPALLPRAFLIYDSGNGFVASPNLMLSYAYSSIQTGTTHLIDFAALMARLGVSTVVIEGEVGGSYPFGFNAAPDYPLILNSLNRTGGLAAPLVIGPDTIYTTNTSNPIASSATDSINAARLTSGTIVPEVNLTSLYANSTLLQTPLAPQPLFPLTPSSFGDGVSLNTAVKQALQRQPLGQPLTQFEQPIVFNGAPIPISTAAYDTISITFSTNSNTAVTIAVVDQSNLSALSPATLPAHLFVLGGAASNLGLGTSSLFSAYGADHFWTNGSSVTLTDDLRQTMYPYSGSTVYYLLFSLFPVVNGVGTPGVPVANWTGTQGFTIQSIILGNPFYAPATVASSSVSIAVPGGPRLENLTGSYFSSTINQTSSSAPAHNFLPAYSPGLLNASLNQTVKAKIAASPLASPFGAGYPPSVFNENPLTISLSSFSYLNVAFSTNGATAATVALLSAENLSGLTSSSLQNATIVLGGSGNSLGYGDPALYPAFGADHYSSPGSVAEMSQTLTQLDAPEIPPVAYYLVFSLFPVAANGTGIRFVPVQDWPGVQNLNVYSVELSSYLIDGYPHPEPPAFFGPAPAVDWQGADPFDPNTALVANPLPPLEPVASVTISPLSPVSYTVQVRTSAPSSGPFLIVFRQNFASGWEATGPSLANATHVEVDFGLNGFLLYLRQNTTSVTLTIDFSGQSSYTLALRAGFSIALVAIVGAPAMAGTRWLVRRHRRVA